MLFKRGDVEQAASPRPTSSIEGTYALRPAARRPTWSPTSASRQWDGSDKLTFWTSTQSAFMVRGTLAEVLGLPLGKVRVLCDHMGGGFGAKQDLFQHEFLCALLARQTRRPVRMESRARRRSSAGARAIPARSGCKQGFKRDGTITARAGEAWCSTRGAYGCHAPGVTAVGTSALTSLYRCENVHLEGRAIYTNTPIAGAFRGYGVVQTYYALDIQMDEAAEQLGMDPAELKLKNAVREGDIAPSDHPIVGHGLEDCIRRGMEEIGWKKRCAERKPRTGAPASSPRAAGAWAARCTARAPIPGIKEQGNAIVKLNEDGSATLLTGAAGLGTGAHTALAQIVAEELGSSSRPSRSCTATPTSCRGTSARSRATRPTWSARRRRWRRPRSRSKLLERAAEQLEVVACRSRDRARLHRGAAACRASGITVRDCVGAEAAAFPPRISSAPAPTCRPSRIRSPRISSRSRSIPGPGQIDVLPGRAGARDRQA